MLLRLDKILSNQKEFSRRELKSIIKSGRVAVNGQPVFSANEKFDPQSHITLDGVAVEYKKFRYFMLNKPAGVISATEDQREQTALSLLPQRFAKMGLFPAGRLDKDSEGLLLLTNDGETAHALLSPKRHVDKLYFVRVRGRLEASDADTFASGMCIDGGEICLPAELCILESDEESTAYVTLREGKFHQIKRMFAVLGKTVIYLKRLRIGNLTLDPSLKPGEFRELNETEVLNLFPHDAAK